MTHPLHIMYDLETLGTGDGAAIVQLGATGFGFDWPEPEYEDGLMMGTPHGGQFRANVDLADPDIGVLDGPTVDWWLRQSEDARRRVFHEPERLPLSRVLVQFREWAESWPDCELVGLWSALDFDHRLLRQAYERTGLGWPDRWRKLGRDYRTLKWIGRELCGEEPPPFVGVQHDALDDACHQAAHAVKVLGQITVTVPDITMCANRECPSRMSCHRFTAEPSRRQSFAVFGPNADECGHYWPNGRARSFIREADGTVEEWTPERTGTIVHPDDS